MPTVSVIRVFANKGGSMLFLLALVIGLAGALFLCLYPPFGVVLLVIGVLLALLNEKRRREALEAERHREYMESVRRNR